VPVNVVEKVALIKANTNFEDNFFNFPKVMTILLILHLQHISVFKFLDQRIMPIKIGFQKIWV